MRRFSTLGRSRPVVSAAAALAIAAAAAAVVTFGSSAQASAADLACGRPASASSNTATAGRADDCAAGTVWQSGTTKPQQWQVDLGAGTTVDHVTVTWGAGYATTYKIRTSDDGSLWHTVVGTSTGHGGTETLTLPADTKTRWIQLYLSQYTGTAGFTIDEVAVYGTPGAPGSSSSPSTTPSTAPSTTPSTSPSTSPSTKPSTSPSTSPSSSPSTPAGGHTWNVTTAAALTAALAGVAPGDTIALAPGSYDGAFFATTSGTSSKPITLSGPRSAVLSNSASGCDPNVPSSPADISYCGYGLHLNGVSYWHLSGFAVTGSAKGIVLDRSSDNTLDGVEVSNTGDEGVHFRADSSDNLIENSSIHDTGHVDPGFGEGLYFGSAQSNWSKYGENGGTGQDRSNNNKAVGNSFGPGIAAEHIDIKEGTSGGVVQGNTFTGGVSGENSADSWVDVKGSDYTLTGNHGSYGSGGILADGYQVHQIVAPFGCGNVWKGNDSDLGGVGGYAVNVTDQSRCTTDPNVVYSSNTVTRAVTGLTNITVTAGG